MNYRELATRQTDKISPLPGGIHGEDGRWKSLQTEGEAEWPEESVGMFGRFVRDVACRSMTPGRKFPLLSTKRLTLRAPTLADTAAFLAVLSIPDVTRFSNWPDAPTKAQGERFLRWMCKLHASGNGCAWIIEHRNSRTVAGAIRFNSFERKWRSGEIGYELHPDFWGKGLMTEAVHVAVSCGHQTFGLNRIEAWTLPGNPASDRVLEKSGFQYEGTLRQKAWFKGAYHDFRMFARVAADPAT